MRRSQSSVTQFLEKVAMFVVASFMMAIALFLIIQVLIRL